MVKKSFQKKVNVFKGESNPFNMKINREKRCILGQKVKGTKGLRGFSRAESHAKRKELWQKTKVSVEKASRFLDKTLMNGEDDDGIDRFVLERKNKLKKSTFNLKEESLTHKGMPLDVTKTFPDRESDDEEQLDASYVNQAHFGGFSSESKEPKSHKEIMEELIVESKKKKYEKKLEKEVNQDLTENLDKGWKDILSVVGGMKFGNSHSVSEKPDPYILLTNQLKFEKRGTPVSRTKTAEELKKEEKERIEKLEEERLSRMNADLEHKFKNSKDDHISADGIYDDFDFEPISVENDVKEAPVTQDESERSESEESESDGDEESAEENEEDEEMESEDELDVPKNDVSSKMERNTSNIPENMEDFEAYLNVINSTSEKVDEAVGDILKPCLKAKSEKTLKKLAVFFGVLVEYSLKHLRTNINISGKLVPHLHTIAEISPLYSAEAFLEYLDKEQQSYQDSKKLKKKSGFPSLKCILILKYCSVLFSVSDYRHPVVTPAMNFMCDILSSKFLMTTSNITSRLFVCSVIADCVSQSKRFVPEVICFLNKVLQLAIPFKTKTTSKVTKKKEIDLIVQKESASSKIVDLNITNIGKSTLDDSIKQSIISNAVSQLHKFATLYTDLPSSAEMFSKTLVLCSQLPTSHYSDCLKNSLESFSSEIKKENTLCHLVYQNTKPKPLKLFEPSFESKFDKKDNIAKKFKLLKRVSQKIRKEEKSVVREMRRDAQMIAAEKLRETLESDAERKRKVKELYHELATQEGEYKKMMKKKS